MSNRQRSVLSSTCLRVGRKTDREISHRGPAITSSAFRVPRGGETTDDSTSPTRANILQKLYSLIGNTDILPGNNNIVYFAENGARYDAQEYYRNKVPPEIFIASIRPPQCTVSFGPRHSGR